MAGIKGETGSSWSLSHPASQSWNQMGKWMKKADSGSQGDEEEPVLGVLL